MEELTVGQVRLYLGASLRRQHHVREIHRSKRPICDQGKTELKLSTMVTGNLEGAYYLVIFSSLTTNSLYFCHLQVKGFSI
jgi:hypothetical protein